MTMLWIVMLMTLVGVIGSFDVNTPLVSADWLRRNFDGPELVVLDASPETNMLNMAVEYPEKRIPGARHFDLKSQFSDKDSTLPNMLPSPENFTLACQTLGLNSTSKIVIYDNLGLYASPRAWWMFRTMGHEKVSVLDGGLNDWIANDGPTEPMAEQSFTLGNFVAKFDGGKIKTAARVLENIQSKSFTVVDARSSGRFNAEVPEPRPTSRSGRIPGSRNLPFAELCRGGKYLPKGELKALFDEMNLGDGPLVFSCGSGMTACVNLLGAALVLDNELALYDGSWSEWGAVDAAWPIE